MWWSLKNRALVLAAAVLLLGWGAYRALTMPVDVFPDLTAPTVTVLTEAHGMAPEEVETLITFPIETALNGAAGVRRVRSSSGVGISVVWVEFNWDMDIFRARQIVAEKLQLARGALPKDIEPPVMAPVSSIMGEIMFIALAGEDPQELKTLADWVVRRRLLAVPGVSQVVPIGGDTKQYQVLLNPDRLLAFNLTVNEVVDAVRGSNQNTSAGFYHEGGREYLIHGWGRIRDAADLEQALVTMREGAPVRVKDLGSVRLGAALKRGEGALNGRAAVVIGIQKQPDANTLTLTAELDSVLDDIQGGLPEGVTVARDMFRQADFIEVAVANVRDALLEGALLVVLVMFVFLVDSRATTITVIAIPLSLAAAVLTLHLFGATINTMTLGGMAIAIGALVDDAVIDVENVVRRLRENAARETPEPMLRVVFEAGREIRVSIVFATVIIVLVFLPLFFLSGVEGRLLQPLGLAYIVSLGASLVTALTVTPVLCSLWLTRRKTLERAHDGRVIAWLKGLYRPVLQRLLPAWRRVTLPALLLTVAAVIWLANTGRSFLPDFNEGTLTISAVTLPGTSLEESDAVGRMVETLLARHEEVVSTARRTGRAELDEHAQGVNASEIDVRLRPTERSKDAFLAALRDDFALIPGTNVTIGQPISHRIDHMLSGTRANIAVKIFGEDLHALRRLAQQVKTAMEGVAGVVDLSVEQQAPIPYVAFNLNREAIARYGLTVHAVSETIETAFVGQEVSRVLEGRAAFDLVVRLAEAPRDDVNRLRRLTVVTPSGAHVPLHVLADIRKTTGVNTISRENVQRKIVVMCNVAGRDLSHVVADIQEAVNRDVQRPVGTHISYGGQFESAVQAGRTLSLLGVAVIAGIFLLLCWSLGTVRDALLVMVNLPFALIGGVVGVYLGGGTLSIAAVIGFITLFGIATRNGILLVSHIQHLMMMEGVTRLREAVERAALERLAPILMTALSAALALVPLAMKAGQPGGEIEAPMAVVILCGLTTSTLLNLIVVPVLYARFGREPRKTLST
nr:efflux RND transporter permease subunit [Acanthopleuribacter pedis]